MTEINEPINVWVLFKNGILQPLIFDWHQRRIKIDKINLVHTSKTSQARLFYHFSVSAGNNFYRLKFDTADMKWFIESLEEGD